MSWSLSSVTLWEKCSRNCTFTTIVKKESLVLSPTHNHQTHLVKETEAFMISSWSENRSGIVKHHNGQSGFSVAWTPFSHQWDVVPEARLRFCWLKHIHIIYIPNLCSDWCLLFQKCTRLIPISDWLDACEQRTCVHYPHWSADAPLSGYQM